MSFPPFQMRSVSLPARIAFALFGPRTNRIASAMLLFPEPFGPVIDVYPWRKGTEIFRPNDLKFSIWISFRNKASPDRWKVSAGKHCYYPSHLYPSGVRRESDRNAEGDDGYKSVAGKIRALTNCLFMGQQFFVLSHMKSWLRVGDVNRSERFHFVRHRAHVRHRAAGGLQSLLVHFQARTEALPANRSIGASFHNTPARTAPT